MVTSLSIQRLHFSSRPINDGRADLTTSMGSNIPHNRNNVCLEPLTFAKDAQTVTTEYCIYLEHIAVGSQTGLVLCV